MSERASVCDAARERAGKLRDIAIAEDHSWSIPEVLRHDASLILSLSIELERLRVALQDVQGIALNGTTGESREERLAAVDARVSRALRV